MGDAAKVWVYCSLLALQYGLQPMISSKFSAPSISKCSIVIGTELGKIIIAMASIGIFEAKGTLNSITSNWTLRDSLQKAFLPASLYAIQNMLVQYSYIYLDSMTFNVLNQLKTISAAFWLFFLMDQRQSLMQMLALILLLLGAIVLNMPSGSVAMKTSYSAEANLGIICVLIASTLSGLSAALTQRALVGSAPRHSLFFSAELAVYGILFILVSALFSGGEEAQRMKSGTLFDHWDMRVLVPVITNAFGGLIVGLVTKYAGGVKKGFALIAGIALTAVVSWAWENKPLATKDWVAILLVSVAIYMHSKYPYNKGAKPVDKEHRKAE